VGGVTQHTGDKAASADLFLRAGRAAQGDKTNARAWLGRARSLAPRQAVGRDAIDLLRVLNRDGH
jgi:hypothetical protein